MLQYSVEPFRWDIIEPRFGAQPPIAAAEREPQHCRHCKITEGWLAGLVINLESRKNNDHLTLLCLSVGWVTTLTICAGTLCKKIYCVTPRKISSRTVCMPWDHWYTIALTKLVSDKKQLSVQEILVLPFGEKVKRSILPTHHLRWVVDLKALPVSWQPDQSPVCGKWQVRPFTLGNSDNSTEDPTHDEKRTTLFMEPLTKELCFFKW